MSRYVYLGDRFTDPALIGQPCDPLLRADGKCLVGRKPRNQAVRFEDGREVVVVARRLRLTDKEVTPPRKAERGAAVRSVAAATDSVGGPISSGLEQERRPDSSPSSRRQDTAEAPAR